MSPFEQLPKDSWVIGRAEDCDLIVTEPTVGSHHCRLTRREDGFVLEDLESRNGTFVNGVKIAPGAPVPVQRGMRIMLGSLAEMPWPATHNRPPSETVISPLVSAGGASRITIGRNPESSVPVDLPTVSWNHAVITVENGRYILEDLGSTNGTSIGQLNNRIKRTVLDPGADVFLGSYKIAAAQLLSPARKIEIGESASTKVAFPQDKSVLEIGRDPHSDVPLEFPMISWRHARLTRAPEGIVVEDLGSRNGTYVDGLRISGKILIKPGQEIGLGSFRFHLLAGGELQQREYYGNVTIEASDIVVCKPKGSERLLNPVSLTVFPSELVAVMGPSGSGKTTFLKALNGYTRPSEGKVLFNGSDLYQYYDRFRHQMGYVPQDDIVHPQLTIREAVYFSARLRTDLSDAEIAGRTEKVLRELGFEAGDMDKVIGSPERSLLSGGQRKRVNIALELITDTPVLFLDEPTSGLSSYDAESIVDLLKGLSKSGKTIVTTIHQPSLKAYKQFDDLIMICRDQDTPGAMVFFGPAYPDSIQFFNPRPAGVTAPGVPQELSPEMLLSGLSAVPKPGRTEVWRQRYLSSHYQKEFVTNRSGVNPDKSGKTGEEAPRRQFGVMQWFALVKRNAIVKLRDKAQTAILLAQAPFLAALVCLIIYPLDASNFAGLTEKLTTAHFLMVVAAIWFGCNNAARDIVGEWTIYRRERMVTLKLLPYVFSKLAILVALCIFQCGSMLAIVYLVCGLHGDFLRVFLVLLVASMIGASLGLCISAISKTNESAIALLPVVLLPMIALAGGIRPIYEIPAVGRVISQAIPARWAFEASLLEEAKAKQWPKAPLPTAAPPAAVTPQSADTAGSTGAALSTLVDVAQHSIPSLVARVSGDGGDRLEPVLDGAQPDQDQTTQPMSFRHRYRNLMALLSMMLAFWVAAVVAILMVRDKDRK